MSDNELPTTKYKAWIMGFEEETTVVLDCNEKECPGAKLLMQRDGLQDGMGFVMCYVPCDKPAQTKTVFCQVQPDMILTHATNPEMLENWEGIVAHLKAQGIKL